MRLRGFLVSAAGVLCLATLPASGQTDLPERAVLDGPSTPLESRLAIDAPDPISPILTINQQALYQESAWGQRVGEKFQADAKALRDENERLFEQLSREEAELTEAAPRLTPAEFQRRAEAFDQRATQVRAERADALRDLSRGEETERSAFLRAAGPILAEVMQERGAVALLDEGAVIISSESIDVTRAMILRLNERLGDGSDIAQGDAAGEAPTDAVDAAPATEAP